MQTYLIKKPQKLEITYDEQILALHYPSLFKKKQNEDREIPFSKIKSVRFFEATYRHGHLQVLYQKPNHALEKVVIDFDTDDNLELRRIYTILADYLERPAEEDLSYVKTGELIMAYLKMRDEG
ncbi:hypothetical protein [Latilactobacillus fuchuensis]|nr:hypothetical protein [Latilactobacillus fuchuensis]